MTCLLYFCTIAVFALFRTNHLMVWHICPEHHFRANEHGTATQLQVAMTLIIPEQYYQKTSALRSLSRSLISITNPLIATALYAFAGLNGVVAADVGSFIIAFSVCCFVFHFQKAKEQRQNIFRLAKRRSGIFETQPYDFVLLLFLSGINLVSSAFDAVLPGYVLPNQRSRPNRSWHRHFLLWVRL